MTSERRVYLLDPQKLTPETIAVTFAKTSRSPESFLEIASELTNEKSSEFHEKWVVGYGHASVAEHAVLHIAIENISRLAVESIESNRLASYTEKSTRYQKWTPDSFYIPTEFKQHPAQDLYIETCKQLFNAYLGSIPALKKWIRVKFPQRESETESAWDRRVRSEYADIARFLLPASSLANVGVTINARALEHALCKMLSHPLEEVRTIGEQIKIVAQQEVPTLVKYAHPVAYLQNMQEQLTKIANIPQLDTAQAWCTLVYFDPEIENRLLASALYRYGNSDYAQYMGFVKSASPSDRKNLANTLAANLGEHDIPIRELEHAVYTFDLTLDQGAYFELKRHRMMTQSPQSLSTRLGYALPRGMVEAGIDALYNDTMEKAAGAFDQLYEYDPAAASYLVPNGYLRRVLLTMNLRTARHFIQLRSASNAHFSMRRVAAKISELIQESTPLLSKLLNLKTAETWQEVDLNYFHL